MANNIIRPFDTLRLELFQRVNNEIPNSIFERLNEIFLGINVMILAFKNERILVSANFENILTIMQTGNGSNFYILVNSVFSPNEINIVNLNQLFFLLNAEIEERRNQQGNLILRRTISNVNIPQEIRNLVLNSDVTNIGLHIDQDMIPNYNYA